jgi:hypothetical protein
MDNGTMEKMEQWNNGTMEQWNNGTKGQLDNRTVEQWNSFKLQPLELLSVFGSDKADFFLFREDDHKY